MLASSRARAALPGPLPARFSFSLCWTEDCLGRVLERPPCWMGNVCTNMGHRKFLCCVKSISIFEFYLPQCGKFCEAFLTV